MVKHLRFVLLLALVLALVPAAHTTHAAPTLQSTTMARVRFVNATPDVYSIDGYIDGQLSYSAITEWSNYVDIYPSTEEYVFSIRVSGQNTELGSVNMVAAAGDHITVAVMNVEGSYEIKTYVDNGLAIPRNMSRVKVVNAAPDAGAISVTVGETPVAGDLNYGDVSEELPIYVASYPVVVATADGTVLVSEEARSFADQHTVALFIVGTGGTYKIVAAEGLAQRPDLNSQFRVANMCRGLGAVDFYINHEPAALFQNQVFGSITNGFAVGYGPYVFDVYPTGANPADTAPLASGSFEVQPDQAILFVIQGEATAPVAATYVSDTSVLPPNSSRFTVINLADGNPAFKVERMEGGTLIDAVDVAPAQASNVVPAGMYNLRVVDSSTGDMMMELGSVNMPNGSATTLVVYDDDPEVALVNGAAVSLENLPTNAMARFAHFNVFGPTVDIYLNGTLMAPALSYKNVTDYMMFDPGNYTITAYPAGSDPAAALEPLASLDIQLLGDNFARTIFVFGEADQVRFGSAPDSFELLPSGQSRFRFIDAAIGLNSANVINPTDNSVVFENLQFGGNSTNSNVPSGTYSFNFVTPDGAVAATVPGVVMEDGKLYTIILAGAYGVEPGIEPIVLEATP
jgi:hypothetical protein